MDHLQVNYQFKDFRAAMKFVNDVAELAERRDHHPDIEIKYNKVQLTFYTHTVNAVTEKDRQLAAEIDKLMGP
jgi:4a-hydroxytetrahydrobiopterin dehydratase